MGFCRVLNINEGEKLTENQNENQNQVNIEAQQQKQFEAMINQAMHEGGIQLTAMKGYGKTRMLFSIAQTIRNLENSRVIIFDGSLAWLYNFSRIPAFNINEEDIQATKQKTALDIEDYSFTNWQIVKLALETHKDLLFRLKTRKPSKRGFAIRTIINYLDTLQRNEIEQSATHQPQKSIAYFIEEFQDAFNNRSTLRNDCEEFLSVFNESRNQKESFFTCSQRETDCSKTLRTKQLMLYGKIPECDKSAYHRRLEKQCGINFSNLPLRTWIFEGQKIVSPNWIQQQKPFIINRMLRAKYQTETQTKNKLPLWKKFICALFLMENPKPMQPKTQTQNTDTETEENIKEDSQGDGLFMENGDDLFPEEI